MATNPLSCFFIQLLEQLLKFVVNFTLLKYVKSQRSYGFFNHKRADFWFQNFGLKRSLLSLLKYIDRLKADIVFLSSCTTSLEFTDSQIISLVSAEKYKGFL